MKIWILFLVICFASGFIPYATMSRIQRWLTMGMVASLCVGYFVFNQI